MESRAAPIPITGDLFKGWHLNEKLNGKELPHGKIRGQCPPCRGHGNSCSNQGVGVAGKIKKMSGEWQVVLLLLFQVHSEAVENF